MVEIEESAEAVAPLHLGGRALRWGRVLQKPVVESLMVSLAVVVLDVLPHEEAQVVLTERDHSIETFLFDRTAKMRPVPEPLQESLEARPFILLTIER